MKKAATIPWWDIEERYSALFPSDTGMPAKPLQTVMGSLMIQKKYDYSDRELVEQIRENPYYQYFIGLPGYQDEQPFLPSLLVEFRKRLTDEILIEINERLSFDAYNESDVLIESIKKYHQRTGHYPERVLVDQIYRNRNNRAFCKEHNIRISGAALGRPKQETDLYLSEGQDAGT